MSTDKIIIIGYSGHAYVVIDALEASGEDVFGYCQNQEKIDNHLSLNYLGSEKNESAIALLQKNRCFIAIGNNAIRERVYIHLKENKIKVFINAVHPSAIISSRAKIQDLILIAPNVTINAFAEIGKGVICNSASIIEHECKINDFAHIAPGATLAGNVSIGKRSFIGANSVIKEGITIGKDVIVGAGSVVIKDIPDGQILVGNPAQPIKTNKS